MTTPIRIAVLGASGYTGADLVRLALTHPRIEIAALSANSKAGQTMADIWPHFAPYPRLPRLITSEAVDYASIDAVFGCLPHAASASLLGTLTGVKIVDLSADFRLKDAASYADWYGGKHPAPALLPSAVYGLTEFARDALPGAMLTACPGCYPTAVLLALLPLVAAGAIGADRITVNALSGVSGAGRSLKEANLFPEVAEAVHPYGIGRHRHMPEMEQELSGAAGRPVTSSLPASSKPTAALPSCAPSSPTAMPAKPLSTCCPKALRRRRGWCAAPTMPSSTSLPIACPAAPSSSPPSTIW